MDDGLKFKSAKYTKVVQKAKRVIIFITKLCFFLFVLLLLSIPFMIYFDKYYSTIQEFRKVNNRDQSEIKNLLRTVNTGKTVQAESKLIFREKSPIPMSSASEICYVNFISSPNIADITEDQLRKNGYELVERSRCIAYRKDLSQSSKEWKAPRFHYVEGTLVYGSTKHLALTAVSSEQSVQIWRKEWDEIMLYPNESIIKKMSLYAECYGPLGMCN